MKKLLRTLSLALVLSLGLGFVAACQSDEPEETQTTTTTTTAPTEDPADSDDTDDTADTDDTDDSDSEGPQEYEGELYKMRILGSEGTTGKFLFSERERYNIWPVFEDMLHRYGLDPEFEAVAQDQYTTTIQTRMASGSDLPEFAKLTELGDTTIFRLADNGQILAMNEIVEDHSFTGESQEFFSTGKGARSWMLNTRDDGKVFFISQIQETTYDGELGSTNIVMQIRQDWLEAVGLDTPTTAQEFKEALVAFQENDVNGNGMPDEIISHNFANFGGGISEWFGLVYGLHNFAIIDGEPTEYTSPWYQEGARAYFEYLHDLNSEGLLDPAVIGSTAQNTNIENNRAAAVSNYTMATWNEPAVAGAEDPRYLPLGALQGTDGVEPLLGIEPPSMSWGRWGFTNQATDMDANGRLIDLLASEEYELLTQWGLEGETHEVDANGNRQLLPIALHDAYDEAYDAGMVIGDFLWANGHMFMKRRFVPMENEISQVPEYKANAQIELIGYPNTTPIGSENYLPVATVADTERMLELSTDLTTRSQELATNLILGNEDIADWDQHIAELDELGLRETVEIQQGRLDRAIELGIFD
mgnify:CR=1 FL=1